MDETRLARLGALAALLVVVLAGVPYAVADATEVSVYYGVGVVGPHLLAILAAVTLVALLGGARGRSDPATVAGVAVVFGVVVAGLLVQWALVAGPVVGGMASVGAWFEYHRWAMVAAGTALAVLTALDARSVLASA